MRKPDPHRMVTVFSGATWDADLLAMQLQDAGLDCFLPDKNTKVVDPFITGANPLDSRIQVRAGDAEEATRIIDEARASLTAAPLEDDEDESADDEYDDELAPEDEVEYLATRTRWAAAWTLMPLFAIASAPLALLYLRLYLGASREHGRQSKSHGLTVAAPFLGLALLAGWVFLLLQL